MKIKEIKRCRICGNSDLIPILNLGVQALSGRFPYKDEPDPPKAPLELLKCNDAESSSTESGDTDFSFTSRGGFSK